MGAAPPSGSHGKHRPYVVSYLPLPARPDARGGRIPPTLWPRIRLTRRRGALRRRRQSGTSSARARRPTDPTVNLVADEAKSDGQ